MRGYNKCPCCRPYRGMTGITSDEGWVGVTTDWEGRVGRGITSDEGGGDNRSGGETRQDST